MEGLAAMKKQKSESKGFQPSKKNADKKVVPLLSRSDRIKNFKYMAQCADKYFKETNEQSVIPMNFVSSQIEQLVDIHSQKCLLVTIDLILVVMLKSQQSSEYIQKIMTLSEQAQDDIQKLIMRSKASLDDLISQSQFSQSMADKNSEFNTLE